MCDLDSGLDASECLPGLEVSVTPLGDFDLLNHSLCDFKRGLWEEINSCNSSSMSKCRKGIVLKFSHNCQ